MDPGRHHAPSGAVTVAPYGSWSSPIGVELVAGAAVSLAEPWLDGEDVYWLEGRSTEGGRRTLLRLGPDGAPRELTPAPFRVGSRVHEYGGGSYAVDRGRVVVSAVDDGRLWRIDPTATMDPEPLTAAGQARYADHRFDPANPRLYAVRETHDADQPDRPDLVVNELVAVALDGSSGSGHPLVSGLDFVAAPRPSPDGRWLAWLEWDHPDMPWDATRLRVAAVLPDGRLGTARTVAGGPGVSIVQPAWRADGRLHFVSDQTGWWNLYVLDAAGGPDGPWGTARNLAPMDAELGDPSWVFGRSSYGFLPDGRLLAVARSGGRDRLLVIGPDGEVRPVAARFTEVEGLQVGPSATVAIGAGPHDGPGPRAARPIDGRAGCDPGPLAVRAARSRRCSRTRSRSSFRPATGRPRGRCSSRPPTPPSAAPGTSGRR